MAKSNSKNATPTKSNRSQTFEEYWDAKDVEEGILNATLFEVKDFQDFYSSNMSSCFTDFRVC